MPEATKPSPDGQPLVGASEAAAMLGVELSTFSHLRRREEQNEGSKFPRPMAILRCGPIWKTTDIRRFAAKYVAPRPGPKPLPPETVVKDVPVPSDAKINGAKKVAAKKASVKVTPIKKTTTKKVAVKKVPAAV